MGGSILFPALVKFEFCIPYGVVGFIIVNFPLPLCLWMQFRKETRKNGKNHIFLLCMFGNRDGKSKNK